MKIPSRLNFSVPALVLAIVAHGFQWQPAEAQEPPPAAPAPAPAAPATVETPAVPSADFGKDVAPLFAKNCVACHNAKKAEGGLNLESHTALMKGGDSGVSVVAGDIVTSSLLKRIVDKDDPMPPAGNAVGAKQLSEAEVAIVRAWVAAGAIAPTAAAAPKLQWQPLPPSVHPINALSVSNDGNYVALGRGNQAYVLRQPTASTLDQAYALVDPKVAEVLVANGNQADPATLQAAHLDIVQSIAFSPDTSRVAVGGYRSVKIWRRTLTPLDTLTTGIVAAANTVSAISPDGKYLAVSTDGKAPELINLQTSESQRFLRGHSQPVTALTWIDNASLVTSDASSAVVVTRVEGERGSKALVGQSLPVVKSLVTVAADRLMGVTADAKLVQFSVNSQAATIEAKIVEGLDGVQAVAANTAGPIAVGMASGVCRLLNRADLATLRDIATAGPIQQLSISPNGTLVASSTGSAPAQLWRTEDGAAVATLDRDYRFGQLTFAAQRNVTRQQQLIERLNAQQAELKKASEAEVAALAKVQEARDKAAAEVTTKDTELAAANQAVTDGQKAMAEAEAAVAAAMKMVEAKKAELEAKQKAATEATNKKVAAAEELAKRDQALATSKDASERAAARLPEIETTIKNESQQLETVKKQSEELAANPAAKHQARQLSFAADSSRVVVSDESGRMHLFSSSNGSPEANFETQVPAGAIATTSSGKLISLTNSGVLHQWDLGLSWQLERVIGDHENSPFSDRVTALDFSPDGKQLAVGSGPPSRFGDIKIVDVESGSIAHDFSEVHSDSVLTIRFSPDGRKIASGGADKLCRILDASTGKQLTSLEGHTHHVLSVAWKDDGVTLATGSADLTIKVWNVDTSTQIRTVAGAKKEVTALSFVGQSNQFIAANASGTVQLIDAGNGGQVRAFGGAEGAVLTVGVSSDGKHLFAGGQSGNHWAWQVEDAKKLK
jgi:WD40 repeat protein